MSRLLLDGAMARGADCRLVLAPQQRRLELVQLGNPLRASAARRGGQAEATALLSEEAAAARRVPPRRPRQLGVAAHGDY